MFLKGSYTSCIIWLQTYCFQLDEWIKDFRLKLTIWEKKLFSQDIQKNSILFGNTPKLENRIVP